MRTPSDDDCEGADEDGRSESTSSGSKRTPAEGLKILFGIAGALCYPVLIYFTVDRISPKLLSGILGALVLARVLFLKAQKSGKRPPMRAIVPFVVISAISATLVFFLNNNAILLYIPSMVSVMLAGVFVHSLLRPPTIIEQFAEMDFPVLPPSASKYCRNVTKVWVGIFLCNAASCYAVAAYGPRSWWLAWTTVGIYIFMGLCFGVEYLIRRTQVPVFDAELEAMDLPGENA